MPAERAKRLALLRVWRMHKEFSESSAVRGGWGVSAMLL